jgi:hypothetical protein
MNEIVSRVLIHCPNSGETVGTVLRLRPSAFDGLKGEFSFRCPRCAEVHVWRREDAWLETLGPRPA